MDILFSLAGLLVMPFWIAMIALPGWRWTQRVMRSPWSVAPPAALYAALVVPRAADLFPLLARPTLPVVQTLLGTMESATVGWIHFLAVDLFVGRWAYLDGRDRGVPSWVMAPVLLLTLMFGPLGLLVYLVVREGGRARGAAAALIRLLGPLLRVNRPLAVVAVAMIPLLVATLVGVALDPREITGAPAWLKPAKFAASISVYAFTLLWMLSRVEGRPRLVRATATVSAVALAVEWVLIALQALRGTSSHFNVATPVDTAVLAVMGFFVVVLWGGNVAAAILLLRQPMRDAGFAWSLRLALVSSVLGGAMGAAMLSPTPQQRAALGAGERVEAIGAHGVGVADGGPGLPVTGWSTVGGDVRVAHFLGLHGLQVIPVLGWLLSRSRRVRPGDRLALVVIAGAGYIGFTGILFWQAMRGESVVAPGRATLTALGGLVLVVAAAAVGTVLLRAPRSRGRVDGVTLAHTG